MLQDSEEMSSGHLGEAIRTETEQARRLREKKEHVEKVTKRLYTMKRHPTYVAEQRAVQSKVLNLRQITRQAKAARIHSSLSSIHNLSLSMIEDIKGARIRRHSGMDESLITPLPQLSMPQLPSRKGEAAAYQMKMLTVKMEQILKANSTELEKAEQPTLMRKPSTKTHMRWKGTGVFPRAAAETVRMQLSRDIKRVDTKLRLLVGSLLLLEEEIKQCTSDCVKEKKRLLQKRANSLYTLMDFLKDTRERASQYIRQIDCALNSLPDENAEKMNSLAEAVIAMAARGKAIDFVASQVEVRRRNEITKKELVKYEQVSFSAVVPKIMGRKHEGRSSL